MLIVPHEHRIFVKRNGEEHYKCYANNKIYNFNKYYQVLSYIDLQDNIFPIVAGEQDFVSNFHIDNVLDVNILQYKQNVYTEHQNIFQQLHFKTNDISNQAYEKMPKSLQKLFDHNNYFLVNTMLVQNCLNKYYCVSNGQELELQDNHQYIFKFIIQNQKNLIQITDQSVGIIQLDFENFNLKFKQINYFDNYVKQKIDIVATANDALIFTQDSQYLVFNILNQCVFNGYEQKFPNIRIPTNEYGQKDQVQKRYGNYDVPFYFKNQLSQKKHDQVIQQYLQQIQEQDIKINALVDTTGISLKKMILSSFDQQKLLFQKQISNQQWVYLVQNELNFIIEKNLLFCFQQLKQFLSNQQIFDLVIKNNDKQLINIIRNYQLLQFFFDIIIKSCEYTKILQQQIIEDINIKDQINQLFMIMQMIVIGKCQQNQYCQQIIQLYQKQNNNSQELHYLLDLCLINSNIDVYMILTQDMQQYYQQFANIPSEIVIQSFEISNFAQNDHITLFQKVIQCSNYLNKTQIEQVLKLIDLNNQIMIKSELQQKTSLMFISEFNAYHRFDQKVIDVCLQQVKQKDIQNNTSLIYLAISGYNDQQLLQHLIFSEQNVHNNQNLVASDYVLNNDTQILSANIFNKNSCCEDNLLQKLVFTELTNTKSTIQIINRLLQIKQLHLYINKIQNIQQLLVFESLNTYLIDQTKNQHIIDYLLKQYLIDQDEKYVKQCIEKTLGNQTTLSTYQPSQKLINFIDQQNDLYDVKIDYFEMVFDNFSICFQQKNTQTIKFVKYLINNYNYRQTIKLLNKYSNKYFQQSFSQLYIYELLNQKTQDKGKIIKQLLYSDQFKKLDYFKNSPFRMVQKHIEAQDLKDYNNISNNINIFGQNSKQINQLLQMTNKKYFSTQK